MIYKFISEEPFYYYGSKFAEKGNILETKGRNIIINLDTGCKIEGLDEIIGQLVDSCEFYPEDVHKIVSNYSKTTCDTTDNVNHPKHYTQHPSGVECIDITRHYCFDIGNAIKYLWRAGLKKDASLNDKQKEIEDLKKAIWYIKDRIKELEQ